MTPSTLEFKANTRAAIADADIALFLVDARTGVTPLDERASQNLNITTATDIVKAVPNLRMNAYSSSQVVFNIRGVSQNDYGDQQEPPVAVYQDDSYSSSINLASFPVFDLARVESAPHARRDDDRVLAPRHDRDHGHAGVPVGARLHAGEVQALGRELGAQAAAPLVVTQRAEQRHACAEARRGHGLVRALAAREGGEVLAQQRLASRGEARRAHDEVAMQRAEHADRD